MPPRLVPSTESPSRSDRRRHPRRIEIHPAKIYDGRAERFFAGETANVSESGALLKVARTMPIHAGVEIEVGVDVSRDGILSRRSFLPAQVVRVTPIDRFSQAIAVRFKELNQATALKAA
ncbi:MAG: PilZ domain-containing protein [Phycisphaerales bacterium]